MRPVIRPWKRLCVYPEKPNPSKEEEVEEHVERVEEGSDTKDWAGLNDDLLLAILSQIKSLDDFYAFRGVCTNWRSAAVLSAQNLSSLNPLILLHIQIRRYEHNCHTFSLRDGGSGSDENEIHEGDGGEMSESCDGSSGSDEISKGNDDLDPDEVAEGDDGSESDMMSESDWDYLYRPTFEVHLFDIVEKRFYKKPVSLSSWRSCNYLNFAHGYLAIAFGDGRIQLRHFLSNEKIWLPKTSKAFSDTKHIVFSGNPSSSGCAFARFEHYSPTMEYCLPDREFQWRTYSLSGDIRFMDMIFFDGNLYALLARRFHAYINQLAIVDLANITFRLLGTPVDFHQGAYLMSMGGQLFVFSGRFFVWDFRGQRWIERNNFDGGSMCLSYQQCHACIAPAPDSKVKPNHWYHYDIDNSMFLETSMEEHRTIEYDVDLMDLTDEESIHTGRPVWIFPSMCS